MEQYRTCGYPSDAAEGDFIPHYRFTGYDRLAERRSSNLFLDSKFVLRLGFSAEIQGLCEISDYDFQSGIPFHLYIYNAGCVHRILSEPCDTPSRCGADTIVAVTIYRLSVLLAQLQILDVQRHEIQRNRLMNKTGTPFTMICPLSV